MNCLRQHTIDVEKTVQEECGIVAIYYKKYTANFPLALLAAKGVQHRGQQGAGIAMQTRKGLVRHKKDGLLHEIFSNDLVDNLNQPSRWILVHCRYGTYGNFKPENLQPCIENTIQGDKIAVIHNGEFAAVKKMRKNIGRIFSNLIKEGISDTRLFTLTLALSKSKNLDQKILDCLERTKGSYSLIIGIKNTLYIARDRLGIRPLFLGRIGKSGWMAASETHAFAKAKIKVDREVEKGEIIKINGNGLISLKKDKSKKQHFCDFEFAYFSRPDSLYLLKNKWASFSNFREKCGQILAKETQIKNASFVIGVPDSGIALAIGYANKTGLPYKQALIRDHYDSEAIQRLFMRDDQIEKIKKKVLCKLSIIPDPKIWKNAIVVIGDDSIVRGNVAQEITKTLFSWEVREVHWIVGFPPVSHPCHLGVSIRTNGELIASRYKTNSIKIAKEIGATSVNYISYKGFIKAKFGNSQINKTKFADEIFLANGGCGGCITGLYPKTKEGKYYYDR